jgi:hypothetical protein
MADESLLTGDEAADLLLEHAALLAPIGGDERVPASGAAALQPDPEARPWAA